MVADLAIIALQFFHNSLEIVSDGAFLMQDPHTLFLDPIYDD